LVTKRKNIIHYDCFLKTENSQMLNIINMIQSSKYNFSLVSFPGVQLVVSTDYLLTWFNNTNFEKYRW